MRTLSSLLISLIIFLGISVVFDVIITIVLSLIESFYLRNMAKSDPIMTKIYLRFG